MLVSDEPIVVEEDRAAPATCPVAAREQGSPRLRKRCGDCARNPVMGQVPGFALALRKGLRTIAQRDVQVP